MGKEGSHTITDHIYNKLPEALRDGLGLFLRDIDDTLQSNELTYFLMNFQDDIFQSFHLKYSEKIYPKKIDSEEHITAYYISNPDHFFKNLQRNVKIKTFSRLITSGTEDKKRAKKLLNNPSQDDLLQFIKVYNWQLANDCSFINQNVKKAMEIIYNHSIDEIISEPAIDLGNDSQLISQGLEHSKGNILTGLQKIVDGYGFYQNGLLFSNNPKFNEEFTREVYVFSTMDIPSMENIIRDMQKYVSGIPKSKRHKKDIIRNIEFIEFIFLNLNYVSKLNDHALDNYHPEGEFTAREEIRKLTKKAWNVLKTYDLNYKKYGLYKWTKKRSYNALLTGIGIAAGLALTATIYLHNNDYSQTWTKFENFINSSKAKIEDVKGDYLPLSPVKSKYEPLGFHELSDGLIPIAELSDGQINVLSMMADKYAIVMNDFSDKSISKYKRISQMNNCFIILGIDSKSDIERAEAIITQNGLKMPRYAGYTESGNPSISLLEALSQAHYDTLYGLENQKNIQGEAFLKK